TVARLGGDEFVVLCQDLTSPTGAERVAERIVSSVAEPMTISGQEVFLGASVGLRTLDGADPVTMLRDADTAMYVAKAAGRSRWQLFESEMADGLTERVSVDTDARHALARGQLRLVYQPIVSLADGAVVGVEALLRWRHPVRGDVPPVVTVPALERTGLIHDVGGWAVTEALRTTAAWRTEHGGRRLTTSVNVSSVELTDPAYAKRVLAALAATGTDPGNLCLELTESALIYDWAMLSGILLQLSRLGVRIALDDFGTGYSTLAQLAELPIQVIKIDKTFVAGLASPEGRHHAMATALIDMAAALRIDVVAEGVETPDQAKRLRALNCPHAQGYLFARPMEAADLDSLLHLEQDSPAEHRPSPPQDLSPVHALTGH
ncbi:MAG: bifunctional diguanylate cyclase/phosphodiesterase, partial [Acidimicrobiales bacterium]